MAQMGRVCPIVVTFLVTIIFAQVHPASAQDTETQCLLDFKKSVSDPRSRLVTWSDANVSSICDWVGVTCFKLSTVPVYRLELSGFGLSSGWPAGLQNCRSLATLDLSYNSFTGPISTTICDDLPNLVNLNLQHNRLGGSIPAGFGDCKYLNDLVLNDNDLEGEIPGQVGNAPRLSHFTVANNQLEGMIPATLANKVSNGPGINASSFAGNSYLCGAPLTGACRSKPRKKSNLGAIVGAAVASVCGMMLLIGVLIWVLRRRFLKSQVEDLKGDGGWVRRIRKPRAITVSMFDNPIGRIKFTDLMEATNDFSKSNVISTNLAGTMYKASFPNVAVMAIKRLQVSSQNDRTFKAEMETLGHLRHRNLVPLLGYCVAGGERLLVYKHMPNGSVWDRLHPASGKSFLSWPERVRVATGVARGLGWLHQTCNPRILHRNVNTKSILLDSDDEPRITDFGFARHMNPTDTHVSTFVNGDYRNVGYVAPEYVRTLVATPKGDVYSFGVVLLELVTRQKPVDVVPVTGSFKGNLVEYVNMLSSSGKAADAVDSSLRDNGVDDDEILQILKVAISCVAVEPKDRPTMFEVYQLLRAIGQKYNYTDSFAELPTLGDSNGVDAVK